MVDRRLGRVRSPRGSRGPGDERGLLPGRGPRRVATVALVSKTSRRSPDAEPDYHGLEIGDEFIYGYGLDWDERYRDLPFIALANP